MIGGLLVPALAVTVSLVAVAALLWGLWELRLAYRIHANDPVSVLETAGGGHVEIAGTVEPDGEVLRSPFTETPCVLYTYTVEELRTRQTKNGRKRRWKEIDSGGGGVPFRVDDGSGSVLVEPAGADLRLSSEGSIRVRGGQTPPEPIERFVRETDDVSDENRSMGIGPLEFATGRDRRYRERRLDVGGPVHLLGTARHDTTVARESGQVNAVIGADESGTGGGLRAWLVANAFGPPFLISDVSEGRTALRVAGWGVLAVAVATLIIAVTLLVAVG